jgi:hypothetical protein
MLPYAELSIAELIFFFPAAAAAAAKKQRLLPFKRQLDIRGDASLARSISPLIYTRAADSARRYRALVLKTNCMSSMVSGKVNKKGIVEAVVVRRDAS